MKNLKYSMFFLVFLILSCKKNINPFEGGLNENKFYIQADWVGDVQTLKNMLEFYEQTKDSKSLIGSTLIQKDNATTNFPNITNEGAFNSYFNFLSSNNFVLSNGSQDFFLEKTNESNFTTKTKLIANDIYGRKLTIKAVLNDKLNNRSQDFGSWEESIYIPNTLQISSNMKYFDSVSKRNGSNLIKWIPDNNPENDKGVVIRLRYNPNIEKTTNKATNLPNNIIDKYVVVKDDGTFDVNNIHLKDFPTPLFSLEVTIFRGNFKKSQVNGKNISIVVFDSFSFFTQLKD